MSPDVAELWRFLPWGYALTVALELPVLLVGLSPHHPLRRRLLAGFWLTACTYPIVVLVLPLSLPEAWGRISYLAIAETFAPAAECLLFWATFLRDPPGDAPMPTRRSIARDFAAIIVANLLSFLLGGWVTSLFWR